MADDQNADYYAARRQQARELADVAVDPHVRRVHLDMAERYSKLIADMAAAPHGDGRPGFASLAVGERRLHARSP